MKNKNIIVVSPSEEAFGNISQFLIKKDYLVITTSECDDEQGELSHEFNEINQELSKDCLYGKIAYEKYQFHALKFKEFFSKIQERKIAVLNDYSMQSLFIDIIHNFMDVPTYFQFHYNNYFLSKVIKAKMEKKMNYIEIEPIYFDLLEKEYFVYRAIHAKKSSMVYNVDENHYENFCSLAFKS